MTGLLLFGRLRRWHTNALVAACSGAAILIAGPVHYSLNPDDGYLIAAIAQIPLVSAVLLQASAISPLRAQEHHAARSLRRMRALNYVLLSAVAAAALGIAASYLTTQAGSDQETSLGAVAVIRNLCALTGAGFIGASLLGPSLGWTVPTAWTVLPYVLLTQSSQQHEALTLVTQPDGSFIAFVVAACVWGTGFILATASREDVVNFPRLVAQLLNAQGHGETRAQRHETLTRT